MRHQPDPDQGRPSARRSAPGRGLPPPVARFVRTEASGGAVLVLATVVALVWANSPWRGSYSSLWRSPVVLRIGSVGVEEDLQHLVNVALMAVFFFVVGLEIKRELVRGELADRRVAALPVFAAIGGMVVPATVFLAVAGRSEGSHGWGVPMATDIAFALAVLALYGPRVPSSLKLFLLTLAIVDDIGAVAVIAVAYSSSLDLAYLLAAVAGVGATVALQRARVHWPPVYVAVALVTWYATYRSGVHATLAGVALALALPAREPGSPVERLEDLLHPLSSLVVLPVFALANAGVELRGTMLQAPGAGTVAAAAALGLVLGKPVGILTGASLAVRLRVASLPAGIGWRDIAGVGVLGGIGFTVSLFVAGLAFDRPELAEAAKAAVLVGSVLAAIGGAAWLRASLSRRPPPAPGSRPA